MPIFSIKYAAMSEQRYYAYDDDDDEKLLFCLSHYTVSEDIKRCIQVERENGVVLFAENIYVWEINKELIYIDPMIYGWEIHHFVRIAGLLDSVNRPMELSPIPKGAGKAILVFLVLSCWIYDISTPEMEYKDNVCMFASIKYFYLFRQRMGAEENISKEEKRVWKKLLGLVWLVARKK